MKSIYIPANCIYTERALGYDRVPPTNEMYFVSFIKANVLVLARVIREIIRMQSPDENHQIR